MIQLFFPLLFLANFSTSDVVAVVPNPGTENLMVRQSRGLFTTDWEAATTWKKIEDKTSNERFYIHQRAFPEDAGLTKNSLVLVFAKGYSLANVPEKPMGLPFTYFSSETNLEGYNWYKTTTDRNVDVQLTVPPALEPNFDAGKRSIQFRYFVLSQQFFDERNITPAQVRSLSYKKFVELLGTPE